jgi:GNAT superfamily N-acetyltransferase
MKSFDVRIATTDDAPTLIPMMADFNRLEEIAWSAEAGEPALRTLLGDASLGVVGIVERDADAIGYFVVTWGFDLEWNGRDAFLTELYLVPSERSGGVGRELLARIERIAKEHGVNALHLMVRNENAHARRLYDGAGYVSPPRLFMSKQLR